MRKMMVAVGLAMATLSVANPASAQVRFGAQLNYAEHTHFGMGARLGFPLGGELKRKGIEGLVTFDYFFPKGFAYWTVTADGLYHFTPASSSVKPYVGGGISYGHVSYKTSTPRLGNDSDSD